MLSFELAAARLDGDWHGPPALTVLFDERCPLCRRFAAWLDEQPTLVPIELLPSGSVQARSKFPQLDHDRTSTVLTVVDSSGGVYEAERAWLACAWALPRWQPLAEHLGRKLGLVAVRVVTSTIDRRRHRRRPSPHNPYGRQCDDCGIGPRASHRRD